MVSPCTEHENSLHLYPRVRTVYALDFMHWLGKFEFRVCSSAYILYLL
ncbi:Uncharacterized protein APZ42_024765 [Daphnia magna]|uniref:Uncharacterized protein n=1 Tax=Daphnia magna TaxID=35525 RepID=A0A164TS83_9CRUS|nr:Uncharacterized protein APZ42_024765 [Daphnia magna]